MKTYIDYNNTLQLEDLSIPKDPLNRHYQAFLKEEKRHEVQAIPYKNPPMEWSTIRSKRNRLLSDTDWTQLPDAPLNEEKRSAWTKYRNTLRDLPEIFSDPSTLIWPEPPSLE